MEKLVYALWRRGGVSEADYREQMTGPVARELTAQGAQRISVNLVDEFVAHTRPARITKLDPPLSGVASFWLDTADDRAGCEEALRDASERVAGYLVVESVPLRNTTHTAPLGERTPGVNLVTGIEKPDWITYEAWIDHWHGHHKRVALETQCTYQYVRNVVVRALSKDAPPWSGIVEEGFPADAVTNPMLWYKANGNPETLKRNMKRMLDSVRAFLDLDRVESHPMSEYRISD